MANNEEQENDVVQDCEICGGNIIIEADCDEGDMVFCVDCEKEYTITSADPVELDLLDEENPLLNDWGDPEDIDFD